MAHMSSVHGSKDTTPRKRGRRMKKAPITFRVLLSILQAVSILLGILVNLKNLCGW